MASGNINLVPLVDILTAIVFFSLLTYQGATMAALTAFDLTLPPVVVTTPEQLSRIKSEKDVLNLLLAVRVDNDKLTIDHSEEGGFHQVIEGLDKPSLDQLEALMTSIRNKYPQNADVTVIPADEVSYANVVHVLERLKLSHFTGISLTTKARGAASGA
ncbi:MAG TPA: biopolymer transporter ExbD [Gemmatimonadaceae bacterium]|nr:biopolymer transporter ExbD [Gemmatimonadaceae bacterium]